MIDTLRKPTNQISRQRAAAYLKRSAEARRAWKREHGSNNVKGK